MNFLDDQFGNTVKLGDKERFDREKIDVKNFLWPICQFTSEV